MSSPPSELLKAYQIYYAASQEEQLDSAFVPYFNRLNPRPEWREYWIFRSEYQSGKLFDAEYVGFLSWKFKQKTLMEGRDFVDFVKSNPGYDTYFVNPFPGEAYRYPNVWLQGDHWHPNLVNIAEDLFRKVGRPIDLRNLVMGPHQGAFCNFWVGNRKFWDAYIEFCEPIFQYIENLPENEKCKLFVRADTQIDSPYLPFIIERAYSTLLAQNSSIRSAQLELPSSVMKQQFGRQAKFIYRAKSALNKLYQNPTPLGRLQYRLTGLNLDSRMKLSSLTSAFKTRLRRFIS